MSLLLQQAESRPGFGQPAMSLEPWQHPVVQPTGVVVRRAMPADGPALCDLMDTYTRLGLLLPRTQEQVYRHLREYVVAVEDGVVVGCAGLRIYSEVLAEVVGVAIAATHHRKGIGRVLVEAVLEEARQLSIRRVFALTLQEQFFHRLGFRTVPMTEVPEKIAADKIEGIDRAKCMKATVVCDL